MSKSRLIVGVIGAVALATGLANRGANAGQAKNASPPKNIVQVARSGVGSWPSWGPVSSRLGSLESSQGFSL